MFHYISVHHFPCETAAGAHCYGERLKRGGGCFQGKLWLLWHSSDDEAARGKDHLTRTRGIWDLTTWTSTKPSPRCW